MFNAHYSGGFCYDISTGAAQDPYYDPANWYATDTNTTAFPSTNPSVPLSNPGVIRGLMEIAGSEHLDKLLLLIKYYEQVVEKLASQTIQLQWQFQRVTSNFFRKIILDRITKA